MNKIINDGIVELYSNDQLVMTIGYMSDELVIQVLTNNPIIIGAEDELFNSLEYIFAQDYDFGTNELNDLKTDKELIWHSDCYYNPNDEWSINSINILHIIFENNEYKIMCYKPLDNILNEQSKIHVVAFSPLGNGRYARNINTGVTFQDDFSIKVFNKLKNTNNKKLSKKIK